MKKIRQQILDLEKLGPLPSENNLDPDLIRCYENLYRSITKPITNEEARILVKLFGSDGCFGLASSFVHLIETAPDWPLEDCLSEINNEWIIELRNRAIRGGRLK
ncbi:hypothetical protein NP590_09935 [Methylomonas sp. SURF-2]|uniref:Uncharacterized protein n=1 Tax=Methylomonas subterranea TaxID=2952225 RepID=A0ABT1TG29_9GAMM|nr:hypothetical protein [Methylomonas sp. SURF-2]MCQ8104421.1 hypothetical protein [Methylomonas sp. SURF-2]